MLLATSSELRMSALMYESHKTIIHYLAGDGVDLVRKTVKGYFGRFLCGREVTALERLKGVEGIQQIVERDTPVSFISHYIPGNSLLTAEVIPDEYFDNLEKLMEKMHRYGVADADFAHSKDILVQPNGKPALIDFAASIIYDPSRISTSVTKPLFNYVCDLNKRCLAKRRARFAPHTMSDKERAEAEDIGIIAEIYRTVKRQTKLLRAGSWHR